MVISFSGLGESEACWTRRFIRGIGGWSLPPYSENTDTRNRGLSRAYLFEKDNALVVSVTTGPEGRESGGMGDFDRRYLLAGKLTRVYH
jgi:hypothetical protein